MLARSGWNFFSYFAFFMSFFFEETAMKRAHKSIDGVVYYNESKIKYDENNDRAYLMKLSDAPTDSVIQYIEDMAKEMQLGKISCKVPEDSIEQFIENGYEVEAQIPNYYRYDENVVFASKFINQQRELLSAEELREIASNIELAKSKANSEAKEVNESIRFKVLDKRDLGQAAELYKSVYKTYPYPVYDAAYLESTLDRIMYFGAFLDGRLISCSAAEMNLEGNNVKMKDFVTAKEYFGTGISSELLKIMERIMRIKGISTAYSITRAFSKDMNITFAKNGYQYSGTLKNDLNIAGKIESMNVWYKTL